jgi:hypothetical protein
MADEWDEAAPLPRANASAGPKSGAWHPLHPTVYKGDDPEALETFLYQCRNAFGLDGAPTGGTRRVAWARQFLDTDIGKLWEHQPQPADPDADLWEAFSRFLTNQASNPQTREFDVSQKVEELRMHAGQTPQEFDLQLSALENVLQGSPDSDAKRGRRYFNKLPRELRIALQAQTPLGFVWLRSALVPMAAALWPTIETKAHIRILKRGLSEPPHQRQPSRPDKRQRGDSRPPGYQRPPAGANAGQSDLKFRPASMALLMLMLETQ